METAGYIIVGAICERITFWAFLLCELFMGAILYPDLRLLGLGRRLDVAARLDDESRPRLCGFRRLDGGARRGRILRHGAGHDPRSAPRQVRAGRKAAGVPGAQPRLRRHRDVHPAVRLDGLQPRLHAGRDRPSHLGHRDEHEPRGGRGFGVRDGPLVLHVRQARHHHGLQRHARRTGGHHRAVRFRRPRTPR